MQRKNEEKERPNPNPNQPHPQSNVDQIRSDYIHLADTMIADAAEIVGTVIEGS